MDVDKLVSLLILGILQGAIYAMIGLGMVIIYKSSKILNLTHGSIIMLVGYITLTLTVSQGLPIWVGIPVAILLGGIVAVLIYRLTIAPLIGQPVLSTIQMTFGLVFLLNGVAVLIWGGRFGSLPAFLPQGVWHFGGIDVSQQHFWTALIAAAMFGGLGLFLRLTKLGLGMRATAESSSITESVGVNVRSLFMISWVIGGFAAGVAALLLGQIYNVGLTLGPFGLTKGLPIMLLGGLESLPGVLIAGLIIGVAELFTGAYIDPLVGGGAREIVPFILMLVILLFRPYGLFGLKEIERV